MAEWVRVAGPTACPAGRLVSAMAGRQPIVLANVDGEVCALEDQCSHEAYPLSDGDLEGSEIVCIYHGARFDACTGKNRALPAVRPVRAFRVETRDDGIYVEI
jgi:3-phenylpropionate/trans-cinnamate dioxygenase ferredoxin subunit